MGENMTSMNRNRINAQKSTGPKAAAGKARSSRKTVKHGLCSTTYVLNNEDEAEYLAHENAYVKRLGPRDKL